MKTIILLSLLLAAALALPAAAGAAPIPLGAPAPDFELASLAGPAGGGAGSIAGEGAGSIAGEGAGSIAGGRLSLAELCAGDAPVVLSFFATWCGTCLKEIAALDGIARRHGASVYLVGIDKDRKKLERFVKKNGIKFPVLHDPGGRTTGKKYDLFRGAFAVVPKAYVLSPAGTVEYVSESYSEEKMSALEAKVAEVKAGQWKKGREVTLFFTGSGNGRLAAGGGAGSVAGGGAGSIAGGRGSAYYGGLIKLVSYIKARRARLPASLLVDTGDFLPPAVSTAAAGRFLRGMALAGYDAIGVGDQDIAYAGLAAAARAHDLPLLSSLSLCGGGAGSIAGGGRCSPAGAPGRTVERAGVKIRFLSYIPPEPFALYPEDFVSSLKFRTLEEVLKDGGNADFLVLLSHAGAAADRKLAQAGGGAGSIAGGGAGSIAGQGAGSIAGGVDLIIGGHSQTEMTRAEKTGDTLVVQAGADFRNIGKLTLKFDAEKKLAAYDYELVPLTADIPDDPEAAALLTGGASP